MNVYQYKILIHETQKYLFRTFSWRERIILLKIVVVIEVKGEIN